MARSYVYVTVTYVVGASWFLVDHTVERRVTPAQLKRTGMPEPLLEAWGKIP